MEDQKTVFKRLKEQVEKSSYQKDLHFASENEDAIRTHFLNIKRKETWSYRNNIKLECSGDISNPDFIIYKIRNLPYHGLVNTVLVQNFPVITVEPGFEARWTHNLGSNIVRNGNFKINETELQTLNSKYFDDYIQKINKNDNIDKELGNVPEMQEWSTQLPSFMTIFRIPWFFTLHTSKMFPLYACGKEDEILHEMLLRRYIGDLLIIRRADTKEVIPFDEGCIKVSSYTLPVPEMRAEYEFLSDMECEHNRCEDIMNKYSNNVFDIDNVKSVESDNIHTLNTTVNIKIKDMPFPVHTIHWKAVNLEAEKHNYLSNYTTNALDHTKGASPIKWISLSSPNGIIFKNQDFYIGEKLVSYQNFNKVPKDAGYGCWTNAPNAVDPLYPKPGLKLDESELTFRLENTEHPSSDTFRINIQIVYTYRIAIKDYPRTESERNTKGIEFDISGDL
jgi:hypothetical protein